MFIESDETSKRRPCSCGYISDFPSLEDADEPPVAVTVVPQKEAVAIDDIRLSVYGYNETVGEVGTDSLGMESVIVRVFPVFFAPRVILRD